jgi:hypothetical protein
VQTYNQQVEKNVGVSLPPVTWNADDEARVLEDALWEAALVAAKIEGASVQVRLPTCHIAADDVYAHTHAIATAATVNKTRC